MLEIYSLLFIDSLVAALVLPLNKVLIFKIMSYFGGYNYFLMLLVATLGSVVGSIINWVLGRMIICARMGYHKTQDDYGRLGRYICSVLMLLSLVCSWVPVWGAIVNILSGYFRIRILDLMGLVFISYLGYFIYCIIVL
ncbi:DedA family protein [Ehrlichia ruminantium]|uniref:DedA family protein n=1 Tax=Ehrlichia ruminantium TaxID=779 RepID=A0AAE6QE36_EHRRU|nr:DedA family protein [Ehrlichia ruminantium]QGR02967.1 DedA family protein [Ehrlichia ruminantium]QGR03890.1 DedA family protein [Ehrlichia ruminantium]QGR04815.1 DedA family protein [Ehrlichia ruminantium]